MMSLESIEYITIMKSMMSLESIEYITIMKSMMINYSNKETRSHILIFL
jgi:hypothetical protein